MDCFQSIPFQYFFILLYSSGERNRKLRFSNSVFTSNPRRLVSVQKEIGFSCNLHLLAQRHTGQYAIMQAVCQLNKQCPDVILTVINILRMLSICMDSSYSSFFSLVRPATKKAMSSPKFSDFFYGMWSILYHIVEQRSYNGIGSHTFR